MKSYFTSAILILLIASGLFVFSCSNSSEKAKDGPLPILGFRDVASNGDTIFHEIPDFSFIDQDSNVITNKTFEDKAYIVDFFFIHCPSICPRVKAQMLRLYEKFENENDLVFLSHSIDTRNDTVPALKAYANKLDIETDRWHLVTGEHDLIYTMADKYFVAAVVDEDAPGGFDHSGRIILVDKDRHVRAFAEGTDPDDVTRFMDDVQKLMNEHKALN